MGFWQCGHDLVFPNIIPLENKPTVSPQCGHFIFTPYESNGYSRDPWVLCGDAASVSLSVVWDDRHPGLLYVETTMRDSVSRFMDGGVDFIRLGDS